MLSPQSDWNVEQVGSGGGRWVRRGAGWRRALCSSCPGAGLAPPGTVVRPMHCCLLSSVAWFVKMSLAGVPVSGATRQRATDRAAQTTAVQGLAVPGHKAAGRRGQGGLPELREDSAPTPLPIRLWGSGQQRASPCLVPSLIGIHTSPLNGDRSPTRLGPPRRPHLNLIIHSDRKDLQMRSHSKALGGVRTSTYFGGDTIDHVRAVSYQG